MEITLARRRRRFTFLVAADLPGNVITLETGGAEKRWRPSRRACSSSTLARSAAATHSCALPLLLGSSPPAAQSGRTSAIFGVSLTLRVLVFRRGFSFPVL